MCTICGYDGTGKVLERHMETVHREVTVRRCCGLEFNRAYDLKNHQKNDCLKWFGPCKCCGLRFATGGGLKVHEKKKVEQNLKPSNNYYRPRSVSNIINLFI